MDKLNIEIIDKKWNTELLEFAISNLLNDKFKESNIKFIFADDKKNVILVSKIDDMFEWITLGNQLEVEISKYLKCNVIIEQANVSSGILKIKDVYLKIINRCK